LSKENNKRCQTLSWNATRITLVFKWCKLWNSNLWILSFVSKSVSLTNSYIHSYHL
jgi:hypothetical protein